MSSLKNVRMPPDGVGKRLGVTYTHELGYDGLIGPSFAVGMEVTGASSGFIGKVLRVDEHTATAGALSLEKDHLTPDGVDWYTDNESLTVEGSPYALVDNPEGTDTHEQYERYYNQNLLVSGDNPHYAQNVDIRGSAFMRFYEGAPQLDAFGKLRISEATNLAEYLHDIYPASDDWEITTMGSPVSDTWLPNEAAHLLSTGTVAMQSVVKTTHKYHRYQVGNSQLAMMTLAMGDSGKTNLMRHWGLHDDDDGLYFELLGTTLSVVLRSTTETNPGSPVNTKVAQSSWNGDKLDGTGFSGMTLDVTKMNIYWMDYQWLGAGRVRFGVFAPDGDRIVCHTFENANNNNTTYMRTGNLPLRFMQMNMGTVISTSEMKVYSASVKTEGDFKPHLHDFGYQFGSKAISGSPGAPTPLWSMRMKQTFEGKDNRSYALPDELSMYSNGAFGLSIRLHPTLNGGSPNWQTDPDSESGVEFDTSATSITGGHVIGHHFFDAGAHEYDIKEHFDYVQKHYLRRDYTASNPGVWLNISAYPVGSPAATAITSALNWHEVR
jgi:hypothetical protein